MSRQTWRDCARWLVECGVLPYDHRIMSPDAEVFDLGQTLRDGVILCHLLNHIKPGSIDTLELSNIRSQTSQFLCMKNIRTFLRACSRVFHIREADFFDPAWLFQMSNFGSLIELLSKLSNTEDAMRTGAVSFSTEEEDIYGGLEDLADEHDLANEGDIYDTVDEDEGDKIYDDLVNIRREMSQRTPQPGIEPKKDKRDCCRTEIVETEKKYVEALTMLCDHFIRPLRVVLTRQDLDKIFLNIEELLRRHKTFQRDLDDAFRRSNPTFAQAFKKHKGDFLIYGFYCSNMISAQNHIEKVCANANVRQRIDECQMKANNNRFRLRDLLSVPMQRILKYHLLLKELVKHTDKNHHERKELDEALDEMQDVSMFVNEVKRDHEVMQTNEAIQASLVGYRGENLNEFGRNQKDGELKLKFTGSSATKKGSIWNPTQNSRYCFLFDRVMLVCKSGKGNESHEFHTTIDLAQYKVEDNLPSGKGSGRWNFCFHLTPKDPKEASNSKGSIEVYCKTEEMMLRWVEGIRLAQDNIQPRSSRGHTVEYKSFKEHITCDACQKLLRGLFFQGYKCTTCNITVHKECLNSHTTKACTTFQQGPRAGGATGQTLKLTRSYSGSPMPPNNEQPLHAKGGTNVQVLEIYSSDWKRVRQTTHPNAIGLVPSSFLMENYEQTTVVPRPQRPSTDSQLPDLSYLFTFPWYVGEMERQEANEKLFVKPGCFLLRKGKKGYAISLQHEDQVKHMKVVVDNGQYGLAEQTLFPTMEAMVEHYGSNSLVTVFRGLDALLTKPYRSGGSDNNAKAKRFQLIGQARAMYDFSARDTRELTLQESEMVGIISKAGGHRGWWKGCIGDRIGYFPSTYVEEIDNGHPT